MTIEDMKPKLSEAGFQYFGYGVERTQNDMEKVAQIFQNGLLVNENSLHLTADYLDVHFDYIRSYLENCSSLRTHFIILIKLPEKYINENINFLDPEGKRYRAFFESREEKYYLASKFIVGCYDIEKKKILQNPNYRRLLTEEEYKKMKEEIEIINHFENYPLKETEMHKIAS